MELNRGALKLARLFFDRRNQVAGTIHDGVVQYIVGAKMWIEALEDESLSEEGIQAQKTAADALTDGVKTARQLIGQLRAPVEGAQLKTAISEMVMRYGATADNPFDVEIGEIDPMDGDLADVIASVTEDFVRLAGDSDSRVERIIAQQTDSEISIHFGSSQPLPTDTETLAEILSAIGGTWEVSDTQAVARFPRR